MLPLVIVTALFAGVAALREVAGWRLARAIDAQHPRGADGIVVGAESLEWRRRLDLGIVALYWLYMGLEIRRKPCVISQKL